MATLGLLSRHFSTEQAHRAIAARADHELVMLRRLIRSLGITPAMMNEIHLERQSMTTTPESADWTKRGIVFYGGSQDGKQVDVFPAQASMNFGNEIAGEDLVELYERTSEAHEGRTIFRFVERRQDLED